MATMHRSIRVWGALALGLGTMAPTLALSVNGAGPAGRVGRAVPLAFLVGGIGIMFIGYAFAVLARRFSHAGSAYAFVGATLGPRTGVVSGFALLGFYIFSTFCAVPGTALFVNAFLDSIHVSHVPWLIIGAVACAAVGWLCTQNLRSVVRALIAFEAVGVGLIALLTIVIYAKVGSGHAPSGQHLSLTPFTLPAHTGFAAVGAASVFAWLSWAGFESIATLGEETENPRRNIPRALGGALAITIPLFIVVMLAETLGFGTGSTGSSAFAASGTPLGTLAQSYVGSWAASSLLFVAAASTFACLLGCAAASSRMIFAFARDGFGPAKLAKLSKGDTPSNASSLLMITAFVVAVGMAIKGTTVTNSYFYYATIGTLCLLVAYALVGVSAATIVLRSRRSAVLVALPAVLGTGFAGYVFYVQTTGQSSPYSYFPYIAGAWCLFALACVLARPQMARRIGEKLAAEVAHSTDSDATPLDARSQVPPSIDVFDDEPLAVAAD